MIISEREESEMSTKADRARIVPERQVYVDICPVYSRISDLEAVKLNYAVYDRYQHTLSGPSLIRGCGNCQVAQLSDHSWTPTLRSNSCRVLTG
jgi:hypothetical protein